MSGSDTHRQADKEGVATGSGAPTTATEPRRMAPNDTRLDAEADFSRSGAMTDEIQITNGRDANEDETSEGWADRGGI